MAKKRILFISVILLVSVLFRCTLFVRKVQYKGEEYVIEPSEFGVAFIDKFNSVTYYMHDTIYNCGEKYYCLISGSQDKGDRWVLIEDEKATDIDSAKTAFTSCKKTLKATLLE